MHNERTGNRLDLQFLFKGSLALLTSPGIFFLDSFPLIFVFPFFLAPPPHPRVCRRQGEKDSAV